MAFSVVSDLSYIVSFKCDTVIAFLCYLNLVPWVLFKVTDLTISYLGLYLLFTVGSYKIYTDFEMVRRGLT